MAGQEKEEKLRREVSDGPVRAHKCGCCEKGDKAEGTLEGGQVHYGKGGEFMLESQWGVHVLSGFTPWLLVGPGATWRNWWDDWQIRG